VIDFTPRPPYRLEKTHTYIPQKIGWAPEPVWMFWRRDKLLVPAVIQTSEGLARSLNATRNTFIFVFPSQRNSVQKHHGTQRFMKHDIFWTIWG
jgi:hypothetical protein